MRPDKTAFTGCKLPEHPIVGFEKPFARSEAWQWLLINAAWKDKRVEHKGKALLLKRGDVLAGRSYLAEQWGWGEQRVRTFVHRRLLSRNAR